MDKICRICLEEGVFSSIFAKNFNLALCDMIEYCCNTKISREDNLPKQICSNCMIKLGIAYHFKQTCMSSDIRLRQYLGLPITEKTVDAAVMTDPIVTHQTIIKKCKCKQSQPKKSSSNYRRKAETEKQKTGPKPKPKQIHACYQCNKEFRCQAQLDMHVRTHTGDKPFACMYCPRRFTQKYNLTIHLRVHTGDKPFQCEVCSKRFSAQSNLSAHLKIHTGQKDHVCSLCNKSFITSSELTRHMSKHRGVKDFKCDVCGSAYIHARDLKLHKLKKHQVLPQPKPQAEVYNNSSNIDIIGIDVGKEVPPAPVKDSYHIAHLVNDKSHENRLRPEHVIPNHNHENIPRPEHTITNLSSHSVLPYEQKVVKELYHPHYTNKIIENSSCTICGQAFEYMSALAHHYSHQHKGYEHP
ncbi:hypothetical protein O0L34_g11210 [Tuta absoluta]|nr:hypothetical protein O0L34_g2138 [Tuta absoluta]KAJ2949890.1 hypothetical protein O0L34_g11210 [Tuta absoluta]